MQTEEIWKPVLDHEGKYSVSSKGNVRSEDRITPRPNAHGGISYDKRKGYLLKPRNNGNGYMYITIRSCQGKNKSHAVHRLVLGAFVGRPMHGQVCCHFDADTKNNNLENLRWDTIQENINDKIRHGTSGLGETNSMAVVTEAQVLEIYKRRKEPNSKLRQEFNVSKGCIYGIVYETNWKWLTNPST